MLVLAEYCLHANMSRDGIQDYFEFQSGVGARSLSPELNQDIRKWLKENE